MAAYDIEAPELEIDGMDQMEPQASSFHFASLRIDRILATEKIHNI